MAEEESLAPASIFAGYRIVRQLGEGGFGTVYEAVREDIELTVALKVLRAEVSDNEEVATRFLREAQAVAQLQHPNIVGYVELGEVQGRPFLAMELLRGETLTDLMLREGRVGLGRALEIAIPLIAAVRTVHAQGIVHRDLKPDNVFITYTSSGAIVPKILDFGFAKISAPGMQITRADTAIGTPNFMSPEQMISPREVDPRSDQWAIGVLLYYLLTGVKPFAAKTLGDTLKNVLQFDPPTMREHVPAIPEAVDVAVMRTLRKSPGDRYASVHELAATLIPFANDDTAMLYSAEFLGDSVWDDLVDTDPGHTRASQAQTLPPVTPRVEEVAPQQAPPAMFDPSVPYAPAEQLAPLSHFDPSVPYAPPPMHSEPPPPAPPHPHDPYALSSPVAYSPVPQVDPYVMHHPSDHPQAPQSLQPVVAPSSEHTSRGGSSLAIAGAVLFAVAAIGSASLWVTRRQPEAAHFASPTAASPMSTDAGSDGGDASLNPLR